MVVPWGREEAGPLVEKGVSHPLLQSGIGIVHHGLGREDGGRGDQVGVDHGHFREPVGES